MSLELVKNLMGKPVKDIYGRYVGYVVGMYIDALGQLKAIGIDEGKGSFNEYSSDRILIDNDSLVIIPNWRIDVNRLKKEKQQTELRTKALEELYNSGEIPRYVYEDLHKQFDGELKQLQSSYESLMDSLRKRIVELDRQRESLEKFLGRIKVQNRTGEIDERTYKIMSDYILSLLEKNYLERRDIENILNSFSPPLESEEVKPLIEQELQT
ncbi:MAG: CdvA-like protein [Nitrososphaerota archaeon]|nr:CdvA-like protein [Nitrososphaerota archaeon]